MATDDEGHVTAAGLGGGGLFAFNEQKLRNEYGYESEQALYEVSRQIIKVSAQYQRKPPSPSRG